MTLRFVDGGGSHYATADITRKWTAVGPTGTVAVVSGGAWGGNALRIDPQGCYLQKTIDAQQTWIVGFRMQPPGLPATNAIICQLLDGANGTQCDLRVNSDGTLSVTRNGTAVAGGTSTATVRVGAWNFIELKSKISTSITTGDVQVQLNGVQVINVTAGQSVQSTANATANSIAFSGPYVNTLFNDLYLCDANGTANNTFLGDCRVVTLFPNGAGALTQFSVTGAGSNYLAANEVTPDNDATYVSSNTPGQIDLYTVANLSVAGTIKGVQTVIDARKDDANAHTLAAEVRIGGTNYAGTAAALSVSYVMQTEVRETNPNTGVAWTQGDINTPLQIGINLVS